MRTTLVVGLILAAPLLWEIAWGVGSIRHGLQTPLTDVIFPTHAATRLGLTREEYQLYRHYYGQDVVILNPSSQNPALTDALDTLVTQDELPATKAALVEKWRSQKYPGYLQQAGIDFVLVTADWWSYLSEEEAALLNNPQYYEPLGSWQNPQLFHVIGDSQG